MPSQYDLRNRFLTQQAMIPNPQPPQSLPCINPEIEAGIVGYSPEMGINASKVSIREQVLRQRQEEMRLRNTPQRPERKPRTKDMSDFDSPKAQEFWKRVSLSPGEQARGRNTMTPCGVYFGGRKGA